MDRRFSSPTELLKIERPECWRDDMRPTQLKLKLFEGGGWPFDEFVYLDLTLITHAPLEPLWSALDAIPEPLAILTDWKWDTVNSCVMRIRRDPALAAIWKDYQSGKRYETRLNGDQDYLDASLKANGLSGKVGQIPRELIASYKELLRTNRLSRSKAKKAFEDSCIVKFHGSPRPHEIFEDAYWRAAILSNPLKAIRDTRFLVQELGDAFR